MKDLKEAFNEIEDEQVVKASEINEADEDEFDDVDDTEEFGDDYEPDERAEALATELGVDPREVESKGNNEYEVNGDTYMVLDDEEADDMAYSYVEEFLDDPGISGFTDSFQDWIFDNALSNTDIFEDEMRESNQYYVDDIESENDSEFDNRLISELYDEGLLTDDDFEVDEEGEVDHTQLKDSVDLERKKEDYVDALCDREPDAVEWFKFNFGEDEVREFVNKNCDVDIQAITDEVIRWDGRGHLLNTYDGSELELDNGFYAYRID